MPIATTIDAIRASIVTTIRGITPTYTPMSTDGWRYVDRKSEVPSTGLRTFFVELVDPIESGPVFGGCALHTADLLVWTSYGGLDPAEQQVLKVRDQSDLWRELHRAQIDGASKFEKQPFQTESEEGDGRLWGAHAFTAYIFLPLP